MIISYDNLITRLWLSGAITPFGGGGHASADTIEDGKIDTLIDGRGLPPVPHQWWVDRLGFQQDDPVTDFRSGGVSAHKMKMFWLPVHFVVLHLQWWQITLILLSTVITPHEQTQVLSLAMLVHVVESCPEVHSRFVPKTEAEASKGGSSGILSLDEIITDDASVLPFGITCINITDMLAKFLMFSKAVDKMDALLSAKPFWKMFVDPNAMLVLQEVSLDLLCDVCVELGRERRIRKLEEMEKRKSEKNKGKDGDDAKVGMPGAHDGKVTVFDFSEIIQRTEKRVGDEVLGPGPRDVHELRAIARRVKSKYLMRIQLKEKHSTASAASGGATNPPVPSPLSKQIPQMPSKESVRNVTSTVTNSVMGGVGGIMSGVGGLLKKQPSAAVSNVEINTKRGGADGGGGAVSNETGADEDAMGGQEVQVNIDGTASDNPDRLSPASPKSPINPFASSTSPVGTKEDATENELDKLSAELGDLSAATAEAFDLLSGDDFNMDDLEGVDTEHSEELLDTMDGTIDPFAAFAIDDDDFVM